MTILLVGIAAVFVSFYAKSNASAKTLALILWGATIMWSVDVLFGFHEEGAAYFQATLSNWKDDSLLGICAILLGFGIWFITKKKQASVQ